MQSLEWVVDIIFFQTVNLAPFLAANMSSLSSSSEFPDQAILIPELTFFDGLSMGDNLSTGGDSDIFGLPASTDDQVNNSMFLPSSPSVPSDELYGILIPFDNDVYLPSSFGMNVETCQYQGEEVDSILSDQACEVLVENIDPQVMSDDEHCVQESISQSRKSRRAKHNWLKAEDDALRSIVQQVEMETCRRNNRIWTRVAKEFNRSTGLVMTGKQCREHYIRLNKTYLTGPWTEDEKTYLQQYLNGDLTMGELCMLVRRNKKQINERIAIETRNKAPWSDEEIEELKKLIEELENDYAEISYRMKRFNRTYQQIRNKVKIPQLLNSIW